MYVNPFLREGNIDSINPLSLFVNGFFESASGFTTTGLSTIFHPEDLPASFVFYRAYILLTYHHPVYNLSKYPDLQPIP